MSVLPSHLPGRAETGPTTKESRSRRRSRSSLEEENPETVTKQATHAWATGQHKPRSTKNRGSEPDANRVLINKYTVATSRECVLVIKYKATQNPPNSGKGSSPKFLRVAVRLQI